MKIIFLILANDNEHYLQMQKLWRTYMNTHLNINSYFIKYSSDINTDIVLDNDTIFIKGNESLIPGCLDKTIKSIEYLLENYDFDYLIRTNMSIVWNLEKIYNLILTNNFVAAGHILYKRGVQFQSGTGILLNKNVCQLIIKNKNHIKYDRIDDLSLGILLSNLRIKISPLILFRVCDYENNIQDIDNSTINSFYYFRCKSSIDSNYTIDIMKKIIKLIYNF